MCCNITCKSKFRKINFNNKNMYQRVDSPKNSFWYKYIVLLKISIILSLLGDPKKIMQIS